MRIALATAAACGLAAQTQAQHWGQFARDASRSSIAADSPGALGTPAWSLTHYAGQPISFVGPAGVVTDSMRVYAQGKVGTQHYCLAASQETGDVIWTSPVPAPSLNSWSTPAVDLAGGVVLVASGKFVTALDLHSGALRWQRELGRSVVNASPLVLEDLGRAFITDYDGFGAAASLYCINLRPQGPGNPWQPGEIIWSVPIGGSSGNTPAYADGRVFIAATGSGGPGEIFAFDATASSPHAPLWTFSNVQSAGFFGGVSVQGGAVYAASYAFFGGLLSANLVKLDAATGAMLWSAPSNRTNTTPIVLPGGRIALSGGLYGFGSAPSVQLFQDNGSSATLLWDSAIDTWEDANLNGVIEPGEYFPLGWWTLQPVFWATTAGPRLWAGAVQAGSTNFSGASDLYLLDLDQPPTNPGFIVDHAQGCGSTPAVADGMLFTVGDGVLRAYGQPPCYANCDLSTAAPVLNVADFGCFLSRFAAGDIRANCDLSTNAPALNVADFGCFLSRFAGGCP